MEPASLGHYLEPYLELGTFWAFQVLGEHSFALSLGNDRDQGTSPYQAMLKKADVQFQSQTNNDKKYSSKIDRMDA